MAVARGDEDWAGPLAALFTPPRMPYLTRATSPLIPVTKASLVLKSKPKNSAWFYMLSKSEPIVTASRKPSQPLSDLLTGSFVALSLVRAASEPLSTSSLCRFMSVNVNVYVCVRTRIWGGVHACARTTFLIFCPSQACSRPLGLCWARGADDTQRSASPAPQAFRSQRPEEP